MSFMSLTKSLLVLVIQLALLIWLISIFVSGIISSMRGAPYVPISRKLIVGLLDFAGVVASDTLYDLGSGDGRVLISAVGNFNIVRAVGYEVAFWPYRKSRWLISRSKKNNITVYHKNSFQADVSDASIVYMYLFPKLVDKLAFKLGKELRSGVRVLCPSFPIDTIRHPQFLLKKEGKIGNITAYLYEKI